MIISLYIMMEALQLIESFANLLLEPASTKQRGLSLLPKETTETEPAIDIN